MQKILKNRLYIQCIKNINLHAEKHGMQNLKNTHCISNEKTGVLGNIIYIIISVCIFAFCMLLKIINFMQKCKKQWFSVVYTMFFPRNLHFCMLEKIVKKQHANPKNFCMLKNEKNLCVRP